VELIHS